MLWRMLLYNFQMWTWKNVIRSHFSILGRINESSTFHMESLRLNHWNWQLWEIFKSARSSTSHPPHPTYSYIHKSTNFSPAICTYVHRHINMLIFYQRRGGRNKLFRSVRKSACELPEQRAASLRQVRLNLFIFNLRRLICKYTCFDRESNYFGVELKLHTFDKL